MNPPMVHERPAVDAGAVPSASVSPGLHIRFPILTLKRGPDLMVFAVPALSYDGYIIEIRLFALIRFCLASFMLVETRSNATFITLSVFW